MGAYQTDEKAEDSGSAYVFTKGADGAWSGAGKLTAADAAAYDRFGYSVSISGDTAIAGAFQDDDNGLESGSAYIFETGTQCYSDGDAAGTCVAKMAPRTPIAANAPTAAMARCKTPNNAMMATPTMVMVAMPTAPLK